jgi:hypothetical protein
VFETEDHDFFDILYQQWSRTTGAETSYWMPQEGSGIIDIVSVDRYTQEQKLVLSDVSEADSEFICGLHGAIPDLIRRLHEATDEAVRKDEANDIAQGHLAEALLESAGLKERILELEALVASRTEQVVQERWAGE